MSMNLPRLSLRLAALAFAGFGVALLVRPALLGTLGIELGRPAAVTEIRAFYGGLELGLAVFFALASTRDEWLRPALFAQAASLGGIVLARLVGFAIDGSAEPLLLLFAAIETTGAVLAIAALRRLPPGTNYGG
jgi:peptidoglycan/LPS O-acetylase OafA/YrhL